MFVNNHRATAVSYSSEYRNQVRVLEALTSMIGAISPRYWPPESNIFYVNNVKTSIGVILNNVVEIYSRSTKIIQSPSRDFPPANFFFNS